MNKTCELRKLIKDIVREVLREIKEEEDKKLREEIKKSYGGTDPD